MRIGYQDNTGLYINREIFEQRLKATYTLKNLEKIKALAMGDNPWRTRNMPDTHEIFWFHKTENEYSIPLGMLGTEWWAHIEKRQRWAVRPKLTFSPTLRDDQVQALKNLRKYPVGFMKAGTGVWKSYMILSLAAEIQRDTLIVVNSTVTLKEMIKKCEDFLGVTPRVIGWTKKYRATTQQITVALIHSAHKLNFFEYGAILADECDLYVSTEARQKLWYHCSPDFLYGFSATEKVNLQEDRLINLFFWEAETSIQAVNMTPKIKQIATRYRYPGSLDSNAEFSKMQTHISEDVNRNTLIIETIHGTLQKTETKKALLLTKRTEQAYVFQRMLAEKGIESFVIVGDTPEEERKKIENAVLTSEKEVVLIGNAAILGRWFDMPPLQTVYIQYPNRFDESLKQVVGRVLRKFPWKTYAQVYDFCDNFETALRRQAESRKRVYKKTYWVVVN